MVSRAHGGDPHLCTSQSHQVSGTGRFHRGMDRHPAPLAQVQAELWTMYFDGSLMKTRAGAGLLFISPLGVQRCMSSKYILLRLTTLQNMRPSLTDLGSPSS